MYIGFAFLLSWITVNNDFSNKGPYTVFVKDNGVHTDIVLPVKSDIISWDTIILPSHFGSGKAGEFIGFGWGEKKFYLETPTWSDLKMSTALKALTGFNTTAMHVYYYNEAIEENESTVRLKLTKEEFKKLTSEILSHFVIADKRPVVIENSGYGRIDIFYEAHGCYSLFQTCNTWTGGCLKKAGIKTGVWTPFSMNIMSSVRPE